MSNPVSPDGATRNPAASSSATNGAPTKSSSGLIPTNTVTTKDGLTVRVRIEPTLAVDDVIRQLCINLKIKDPPGVFALRDDTDELVTNDNLRQKIKGKVNLKWVPATVFSTSFMFLCTIVTTRLSELWPCFTSLQLLTFTLVDLSTLLPLKLQR